MHFRLENPHDCFGNGLTGQAIRETLEQHRSIALGNLCGQITSMGDLKNRTVILAKGFLFILLGLIASAMLLFRVPDLSTAVLHVIAIWAFCRFYYFAFYVIEHYVDPGYRFAGLVSFLWFIVRSKSKPASNDDATQD